MGVTPKQTFKGKDIDLSRYHLNVNYERLIRKIAIPGKVVAFNSLPFDLSWESIIDKGVITGLADTGDESYVEISLPHLVMNGMISELEAITNNIRFAYETINIEALLREYISGDRKSLNERLHQLLNFNKDFADRVVPGSPGWLLLMVLLQKSGTLRDEIEILLSDYAQQIKSCYEIIDLAKAYCLILQDQYTANQVMNKFDPEFSIEWELFKVADFRSGYLMNSDETIRLLHLVDRKSNRALFGLDLSKLYLKYLGDREKARRSIMFSLYDGGSEEFADMAVYSAKFLEDAQLAANFLLQAEYAAEHKQHLLRIIFVWQHFLMNDDKAKELINRLNSPGKFHLSHTEIAEIWENIMRNKEKALFHLTIAEKEAKKSAQWVEIAEVFLISFNDFNNGFLYLNRGIATARSFHDYKRCIEVWRKIDKEEEIYKCLQKAESDLDFFYDLIELSVFWNNEMINPYEAKRIVNLAILQAIDAYQLVCCADSLIEIFQVFEEARLIGLSAQEKANKLSDYLCLANFWHKSFNDMDLIKECLTIAENHCHSHFDFRLVADSWKKIVKDGSSSARCLEAAKKFPDERVHPFFGQNNN